MYNEVNRNLIIALNKLWGIGMKEIMGAKKLENIHSDIRGPLFYEAMEMEIGRAHV